MAVSKEIGIPFNSEEIPIGDASNGDLELINLSIDDDIHEEQGEDWSSKMGLNLQHCVKLWKNTPSKHQKLCLALNALFSDRVPISTVSHLKWHSRKSRSRGRVPNLKHCRFQVGKGKKEMRNIHNDVSIKDQSIARDDFESSDVLKPIKTRVQPKRHSHRLFSNSENKPMLIDKKRDVVKGRCLSVHTELKNKIDETSPMAAPRSSETCAENFETFELRGSESSDKVNPGGSDDIIVSIHQNVKNNRQLEVQLIAVNNAENDQTHWGSEKQDDVCSSLSLNEKIGNLCGSEDWNVMPLVLSETGYPMSSNNDANSVEMIDSSKIMRDIQMNCGTKRDTSFSKNGELPICPTKDVAKYEMNMENPCAIDASMYFANSDITASAQGSVKILDVTESVEKHHSIERTLLPLKVYRRRKKNEAKSGLASDVSKSKDAVGHIECDAPDIHSLEKVRRKRKREIDQLKIDEHDFGDFVRGPCEGLRERKKRQTSIYLLDDSIEKKSVNVETTKKSKHKVVSEKNKKPNGNGDHHCNLEGCRMRFVTKEELCLHKRNICTYEGCGKRFSKHRYVVRHQCVHIDDRPLKCSWKGCTMSFKWAWARTEHLRVHTGERPYKCKVSGCELTFRFVSDFSRHRRKTGHYVK